MELAARQMRTQAMLLSTAIGGLHKQQQAKLSGVTDPEDLAAMEAQHKKELKDFEDLERDRLDQEAAKDHAKLKERHFEQVLSYVTEVCPEHTDRIQEERHAAMMESEMELAKRTNEGDLQHRLDQITEAMASKKEAEIEAELEKMEKEMEKEEQKEVMKMTKQMADLSARKLHAISQLKDEQAAELAGCPENKIEELKAEHAVRLQQLTVALDEEEARQHQAMQERIQRRTDDRRKARRFALEQKKELEYKKKTEDLRAEQSRLAAEQAEKLAEKERELSEYKQRMEQGAERRAGTKFAELKRQASMAEREHHTVRLDPAELAAAEQEQETQAKQIAEAVAQPLVERLEALEAMLRGQAAGAGGSMGKVASYVDEQDATWAQQGDNELVQVTPQDLTKRQQATYPFALNFMQTLQRGQPKAVSDIIPASSLPVQTHSSNAFANSYSYDQSTGVLNIRAERLENLGELMLVLAHANAHVRSGDMSDDQSPAFQKEFYNSLAHLMADLHSPQAGATAGPLGAALPPGDGMPPRLTQEEEAARQADHLMRDMQKAHEAHAASESKRRDATRVALERKRTEMRMKNMGSVKENMKKRLAGQATLDDPAKIRAQKSGVKKVFESIDKDKDGRLNMQEFSHMVENLLGESHGVGDESVFKNIDSDGDGFVTFEEIFSWYASGV